MTIQTHFFKDNTQKIESAIPILTCTSQNMIHHEHYFRLYFYIFK